MTVKAPDVPEQIGPWQRLTSESRYENPWIQVFHEDVITPGNTRGLCPLPPSHRRGRYCGR